MSDINFLASIIPLSKIGDEDAKIPYKLIIQGVAVDTSVNKNNWCIDERLLDRVVEGLRQQNLRINHGNTVTDVIGKITDASKEGNKVVFSGIIIGSDPLTAAVKEKIMNGLLDSVSIGMDGLKVVCSICGKNTRAGKDVTHDPMEHEPPGHEIILDGAVKELSVVLDPAYEATKINISSSFISALETYLGPVTPRKVGVTNDVGDGREGRPTENDHIKGENMSGVVPAAEPSGAKAPSLEDIMKTIHDVFGKADQKLAEIEGRIKALEAEIAKRKAEEAEEAEEAKRKAEEAKDVKKDEEEEEAVEGYEAKLSKSTTVMASASGKPDWVAELEEAIFKAQRMR